MNETTTVQCDQCRTCREITNHGELCPECVPPARRTHLARRGVTYQGEPAVTWCTGCDWSMNTGTRTAHDEAHQRHRRAMGETVTARQPRPTMRALAEWAVVAGPERLSLAHIGNRRECKNDLFRIPGSIVGVVEILDAIRDHVCEEPS